jgi:hypothetical protein
MCSPTFFSFLSLFTGIRGADWNTVWRVGSTPQTALSRRQSSNRRELFALILRISLLYSQPSACFTSVDVWACEASSHQEPTDSDLRHLFFSPFLRPHLDCNIINTTNTTIIRGFFLFSLPSFSLFFFWGYSVCIIFCRLGIFGFVLHCSGGFLLHIFFTFVCFDFAFCFLRSYVRNCRFCFIYYRTENYFFF